MSLHSRLRALLRAAVGAADSFAARCGPHAGARIALLVGIVAGLSTAVVYAGLLPGADPHPLRGMNYAVYVAAAEAAVAGESLYDAAPSGYPGEDTYLYPPAVVLAFVTFLAIPEPVGVALFTLGSVGVSLAVGVAVARYVRSAGVSVGRVDVWLLAGFTAFSTHAVPTLYFGNVNLYLAAGVAAGFLALERVGVPSTEAAAEREPRAPSTEAAADREPEVPAERRSRVAALAGVAVGLVALVKAFPALLGLWLARTRSVPALAGWAATGAGGLLLGVVVFGRETTVHYVRAVLVPRSDVAAFVGGVDPGGPFYVTVRRPLSHLLWWVVPDADPLWLTLLSVAVFLPVIALCYRDLSTRQDRLVAMLATAAFAVTVVASYRLYLVLLYVPLLALLYTFEGPGRRAFLAGAVLLSVTVRPGDVLTGLAVAPVPDRVWAPLAPAIAAVSVPMVGVGLLLAGCVRAKLAS